MNPRRRITKWRRHPAVGRFCGILPQFSSSPARSAALFLLLSLTASAFSPVLNLVNPRGVQRGVESEIHFYGDRLAGLQEVLLYKPGLEILSLENKDAKHAIAKIRVAPDAALGEHPLRLRTTGGITYQRTLWVGQFPTTDEKEPNDSFDAPQAVTLGATIQGISNSEDADYYQVSLKKGQRLSIEIEAMRLGRTMFDAYIAILDPKRFELAVSDDSALLRNDGFASIVAPEDGDYRILVREAAYEGNDKCQYRLHVGTFPRPSAVFPTGAKPGETVEFSFVDPTAEGGALKRSLPIPPDANGLFPVFAERDGLLAPSPNWIRVSAANSAIEKEPNNTTKEATPLPAAPCAAHGILGKPADTDVFRFAAKKDQNLTIQVHARRLRSPVDAVIGLRDAKGKSLGNNDDQGGLDSILNWKCPADGEYTVSVRDHLRRGGPDFTYRLEISPRQAAISASLPVAERNNTQKWKMLCVPRGNRYATVVNITRSNLGCDAAFSAPALPAGVTMHVPPVPRSLNSFPVVFEAAPDAPVAGALYPFKISATGDKAPNVSGPLNETIHHVEINNQGAYHTTISELTPVAVIDETPFRIDIGPPAVPIVRNGTMALKVKATRKEGYDEAITARLLWKPPGIGAPVTISIPKGKTEATYELNANDDAPVAEWKICMQGEANTPQGPVLVSSSLVPLRVAEPYVAMKIEMAATEQGRDTSVICKLEQNHAFGGEATAVLSGVPHGVTTGPLKFNKEKKELSFPLKVAADANVGKHANLFCQVTITENGQPIIHSLGQGGVLRIDKPAPAPKKPAAKKDDAKKPPAVAKKDTPPAKKPLSRLEQLRQRAQQQ